MSTDYLIPVKAHPAPIADLGLYADCPLCDRYAPIDGPAHHTTPGHISHSHMKENGAHCPAAGMAITLEAALARDNRLNPDEKAANDRTHRYLTSCKGPLVDELCHHPACHEAVDKGLRWTLGGWRKTTDGALF